MAVACAASICVAPAYRAWRAEPAGALPARATFGDPAHRSRLRELDMVERAGWKPAKATVRRWLKQGC